MQQTSRSDGGSAAAALRPTLIACGAAELDVEPDRFAVAGCETRASARVSHGRVWAGTLSEPEVRHFFLHVVQERPVSRSTAVVYRSGLCCPAEHSLGQRWPVVDLVRPAKSHELPLVLPREVIRPLLRAVRDARRRLGRTTIYVCGLRLPEGVGLATGDIDGARMLSHGWCTFGTAWVDATGTGPLGATSLQKACAAVVRQSALTKHASVHTLRHS